MRGQSGPIATGKRTCRDVRSANRVIPPQQITPSIDRFMDEVILAERGAALSSYLEETLFFIKLLSSGNDFVSRAISKQVCNST